MLRGFLLTAAAAAALAARAAAPPPVDCRTFYSEPGLCPFGGACQCTLGETCSAATAPYGPAPPPPPPPRLRRSDGSCAGQCLTVVPGQCPGPASCVASAGACAAPLPCVPPPANESARSVLLTLAHQGFADGRPGALVYVPTTFDAASAPLSLVVFVHGFHNCVQNCALPEANACNCSWGGGRGTNQAYGLLDSFEAAAVAAAAAPGAGPAASSVAQSLFVAVEVAYDEASSDTGNWSTPGLFRAFLDELLAAPALAPLAGAPRAAADLARVRVFSHSGGYAVAAALASPDVNGNVSAVREVCLLDSLYGSAPQFDAFVRGALAARALGPGAAQARFLSVYTDAGGTEANNRAMAARAAGWLAAANASALMLDDDDAAAPLPPGAVASTPIIFKRSNLTHDDTCRAYFALFLAGVRYGD